MNNEQLILDNIFKNFKNNQENNRQILKIINRLKLEYKPETYNSPIYEFHLLYLFINKLNTLVSQKDSYKYSLIFINNTFILKKKINSIFSIAFKEIDNNNTNLTKNNILKIKQHILENFIIKSFILKDPILINDIGNYYKSVIKKMIIDHLGSIIDQSSLNNTLKFSSSRLQFYNMIFKECRNKKDNILVIFGDYINFDLDELRHDDDFVDNFPIMIKIANAVSINNKQMFTKTEIDILQIKIQNKLFFNINKKIDNDLALILSKKNTIEIVNALMCKEYIEFENLSKIKLDYLEFESEILKFIDYLFS